MPVSRLAAAIASRPRCRLATLPTPLEPGPVLQGGARLWVKRDDLTGLGMGGNKARKLEFLCGAALAEGADCLVTIGAAQSNHCRATAAAGAVLGLDVHLVLGADHAPTAEGTSDPDRGTPSLPTGNRLLSAMFGATQHMSDTNDFTQLTAEAMELADELQAVGRRPYLISVGGSTPVGAIGYAAAMAELAEQCEALGIRPTAVVHASSTGGTHAGLLAGRAALDAEGLPVPDIFGVRVARRSIIGEADETPELARACLGSLGIVNVAVRSRDVRSVEGFMGPDYGVPTPEADAAIGWAARRGAWVLDRVYTGKALAGLLALSADDHLWGVGEDVIFIHTGGQPAVFAPGGAAVTAQPPTR